MVPIMLFGKPFYKLYKLVYFFYIYLKILVDLTRFEINLMKKKRIIVSNRKIKDPSLPQSWGKGASQTNKRVRFLSVTNTFFSIIEYF